MAESPQVFSPYSYEVARVLARKATELYQASSTFRTTNARPCALCVHPQREEIDYQLLIDAKGPALRLAAGRDPAFDGPDRGRWAKDRFIAHRDRHLLPLIRDGVALALTKIEDMPYPKDAATKDRGYWYLMRAFMIHEDARKDGKHMAALMALKEMRAVDVEMLGGISVPADSRRLPPPPAESEQAEEFSDRDNKLMAAFAKSRPKQPIEDVPDGSDQRASDANGTAAEAPR
jgi:hypothetical protein